MFPHRGKRGSGMEVQASAGSHPCRKKRPLLRPRQADAAAYFFLRRSPVNRKPRPSSPNQEPSPFRTGGLFSSSRLHEAFPETGGKRGSPEEHGKPLSRRVCVWWNPTDFKGKPPLVPLAILPPHSVRLPLPSRWNKGLPGRETGGWPHCSPTPSCPVPDPVPSLLQSLGRIRRKTTSRQEAQERCPKNKAVP